MNQKSVKFIGDVAYTLNVVAREEMKTKLLNDILIDMEVCRLEGWDIMQYPIELQKLITNIIDRKC